MAGTHAGGIKAAETNRKKYGESFYSNIGRKGGSAGNTGGFAAMPREKVVAAGRKGGLRSRRTGVGNGERRAPREKKIEKPRFRWPWSK